LAGREIHHGLRPQTSRRWRASEIANSLNVSNRPHKFVHVPPMEAQIKASLMSLLSAIKSADGQTVAAEMTRLDEFLERGRAGLHPQLVHFLQNRSYAKALMYL